MKKIPHQEYHLHEADTQHQYLNLHIVAYTFININTKNLSKLMYFFTHNFSITVKYERIKFLVIALKNAVEIYAWAPKPYHKFMAFKVSRDVII